MKTVLFEGINGEGLDIHEIKPIGDNIPGGGKIALMVYDKDRKNTETYQWLVDYDDDCGFDGWGRNGVKANKKILPGTGVFVKADLDIDLQMAGQVKTGKTLFVAPESGYYIVGNSTPVDVDIHKIVPKGDNLPSGGKISLMVYDKDRKNVETYQWLIDLDDDCGFDGWGRNGVWAVRNLHPGEAVFLNTSVPMTLEFPALDLSK